MLTWQKNTLLERAHKQAHKQMCVLSNKHLFLFVNSLFNLFVLCYNPIVTNLFKSKNLPLGKFLDLNKLEGVTLY